jgi:uncharacterized protein
MYGNKNATKKALQALWLFVPAASIGVVMATYISPGIVGQGIFTLTKAWLVVLPIFWRLKVEKKELKLPKIKLKQINCGVILGLIMSIVILTTYWLIGQRFLNIVEVKNQAIAAGINNVKIYLLGVMYWSFVNSFIEESVWRGFVDRQCLIFLSKISAIVTSALFFTLHHIIALFFYLQNPLLAIICSCGVFIAGVIWSVCYQKSGFWSCYFSHVLADLAIGFVGWHLLFSPT